jgi:alginate O-acetyltransferase complex protein AlgI
MLFNSLDFAVFLPVVLVLYWSIPNDNIRLQNALIVAASYFFYGWWDWRLLGLIFVSTVTDFFIARAISTQPNDRGRTLVLLVSLFLNLGILGFFKYYNFFAGSVGSAFTLFGSSLGFNPMSIVLPVGISFYTFQLLSYTIDVYRKKIDATNDFIAFSAYVSFFPQLVAGPIERATHLLPQFYHKRYFSYPKSVDGLRQILWGLFKKVVIADNCATYVDWVFDSSTAPSGSTIALAAFLFAFQIYCDFSGYSDIAIGTAKLFGIEIMRNFAYPYFSRNIGEFWRRWHISLTTWFKDYVFIPLGGSQRTISITVRNIFIVFILSGIWHGANWTFVFWGLLHAVYYTPLLLRGHRQFVTNINDKDVAANSIADLSRIVLTFTLTTLAWIFFRSPSLSDAFAYISTIFSLSLFESPATMPYVTLLLILFFVAVEWMGRKDQYAIASLGLNWKRAVRLGFYYALILVMFVFAGTSQEFIYFQF